MTTRTRTAIARVLRGYRRQRDTYTRTVQGEPVAWSAKLSRDMAEHYRTLLAGAREMLQTIRDN